MEPTTFGFDAIVEISAATILDQVRSQPGLNTPMDVGDLDGSFHGIGRSWSLDLARGSDTEVTATLRLAVSDGSVGPGLTGLDVTVVVEVPVALRPGGGATDVVLDLPAATATAMVQGARVPIPELEAVLDAAGPQVIASLSVDGSRDGDLTAQRFTSVALHTFGQAGTPDQSIVLGAMLRTDAPTPDPTLSPGPMATAADGVLVALSEDGVRHGVVAPALAEQLEVDRAALPETVGDAETLTIDGVELRRVDLDMGDDGIRLALRAYVGFGVGHVDVDAAATVTFGLQGGMLTVAASRPDLDVDIDLDTWLDVLSLGIGTGIAEGFALAAETVAETLAGQLLQVLGNVDVLPVDVVPGLEVSSVEHRDELFLARGRAPVDLPVPAPTAAITWEFCGEAVEEEVDVLEFTETNCMGTKTYRSVEYAIVSCIAYTIEPSLVPRPLDVEWGFDLGAASASPWVPLIGTSGIVQVPDVRRSYERVGTQVQGRGAVQLEYEVLDEGRRVQFVNRAGDGNYVINSLRARITGGDGSSVTRHAILWVIGSRAERDDYRADTTACFLQENRDGILEYLGAINDLAELERLGVPDLPRDPQEIDLDTLPPLVVREVATRIGAAQPVAAADPASIAALADAHVVLHLADDAVQAQQLSAAPPSLRALEHRPAGVLLDLPQVTANLGPPRG